jgi:hypothetical protein
MAALPAAEAFFAMRGSVGGCFVPNARPAALPPALVPAENETVREVGDLLAALGRAAQTGRITAQEAAVLRARWETAKSVTEGFVMSCEAGMFQRLPVPVWVLGTALWSWLTGDAPLLELAEAGG